MKLVFLFAAFRLCRLAAASLPVGLSVCWRFVAMSLNSREFQSLILRNAYEQKRNRSVCIINPQQNPLVQLCCGCAVQRSTASSSSSYFFFSLHRAPFKENAGRATKPSSSVGNPRAELRRRPRRAARVAASSFFFSPFFFVYTRMHRQQQHKHIAV